MATETVRPGGEAHIQLGVGQEKHRVAIVGGGTAGVTVAASLLRASESDVVIIEPSESHFYQPLWTLVGAGIVPKEVTQRSAARVMPAGAKWIRDRAARLDPSNNTVETASGRKIGYDFLVLAPGLEIDWGGVKGLRESIGRHGVCSIYGYEEAETAWQMLDAFQGGSAIFTSPATPIKCGGAPMKIMWLADDLWRRKGVRHRSEITYATAGTVIFGLEGFKETLEKMVVERGIQTLFQHDLVEIRPATREAVVASLEDETDRKILSYDLLHVTPPMRAPEFIRNSALAHHDVAS